MRYSPKPENLLIAVLLFAVLIISFVGTLAWSVQESGLGIVGYLRQNWLDVCYCVLMLIVLAAYTIELIRGLARYYKSSMK